MPGVPAEHRASALATDLEDSIFQTRRLRSDGWDGPAMAIFCRTLTETGVVVDACRACGMSAKSAYGLRQRLALFAQAWEASITLAREKLADELLARSMRGSIEQIMGRDGSIVGERHAYDNKLAFAVLRRLDRRAELGATYRTPPAAMLPDYAAAVSGDWQLLLDALRDDRADDAALLLAPIPPVAPQPTNCDKGNESNDPPVEGVEGDIVDDDDELPDPRLWWGTGRKEYRTNFPPPEGQDCNERECFGHREYHRSLTADEAERMTRMETADAAERRAADATERDAFFAGLSEPSCPSPVGEADLKAPSALLRGGNVGGGEEQETPADRGGMKPRKPPKSEPPPAPDCSQRGADNPGEFP